MNHLRQGLYEGFPQAFSRHVNAKVVGSIPTAPTNHPFSQQQLSDLSRRQKAAIRASWVAPMARMNESLRCCTKVGRWTVHQRIASFPRTPFVKREVTSPVSRLLLIWLLQQSTIGCG